HGRLRLGAPLHGFRRGRGIPRHGERVMSNGTRFVLMDIEGTTTDIDFVHRVLFPYSAERMASFVQANLTDATVRAALDSVQQTAAEEQKRSIDDGEAVETLLRWIKEDRKHGALKQLQGMIWKQ